MAGYPAAGYPANSVSGATLLNTSEEIEKLFKISNSILYLKTSNLKKGYTLGSLRSKILTRPSVDPLAKLSLFVG